MAASETKKVEEEEDNPSPPALLRQLSTNSQQLLTKAFDQLDKDGRGFITRKEAVEFYQTFCQAKTLSMMGAILKESAAMMIAEFDKRTSGASTDTSATATTTTTTTATTATAQPGDAGKDKDSKAATTASTASAGTEKNISFDEWAEFFQKLQIPDQKLEEILNQFV